MAKILVSKYVLTVDHSFTYKILLNIKKNLLDEKLLKMNKLLEILCNPNRRIPLDTLLKCEIALEKMDFKTYSLPPTGGLTGNKEHPVS